MAPWKFIFNHPNRFIEPWVYSYASVRCEKHAPPVLDPMTFPGLIRAFLGHIDDVLAFEERVKDSGYERQAPAFFFPYGIMELRFLEACFNSTTPGSVQERFFVERVILEDSGATARFQPGGGLDVSLPISGALQAMESLIRRAQRSIK